jgi:UDP:flavonoid glycosyltransferase YjiC (YdhE family)
VVVAGAGARLSTAPGNAVVLDYAPGDVLCGRAALVVGNGGSPVAYQALQAGAPLLGMAGNLDQFLNMKMVERLGAGRCLRARNATVGEIRDAALALIGSADFRRAAERAQAILAAIDRPSRVQTWLLALGA